MCSSTGPASRCASASSLRGGDKLVGLGADQQGRRRDILGIDAVPVDRGGQAEEAFGRHHLLERLAARAQIVARLGAAEHIVAVEAALETLLEFGRGAIAHHAHAAGDGERLVLGAGFDAQRDHAPLQLARGGGGRMRRVGGGDHHQPLHPVGIILRQAEADHAAIGGADQGMRAVQAEMVERRDDRLGLLAGGRRAAAAVVGDEIDAEHAQVGRDRSHRRSRPGRTTSPACRRRGRRRSGSRKCRRRTITSGASFAGRRRAHASFRPGARAPPPRNPRPAARRPERRRMKGWRRPGRGVTSSINIHHTRDAGMK